MRVVTPMRFQALMATMAKMSAPSSSASKQRAASSYSASGTLVPGSVVMASVSASAARSLSNMGRHIDTRRSVCQHIDNHRNEYPGGDMSRVQLALNVADIDESVAFYSKLFGAEPAKRRPGYANFAIDEPPLKLVLVQGVAGEPTRMDHLGVEVETTEEVTAAAARLAAEGLATVTEEDTACCYAVQD